MRWAMFFIGEYTNMIAASIIITLLFLGGFNEFLFIPGALMIILKSSLVFFFFLWTRASWPHLRVDQLSMLCWKILLPLGILNVVITGFALLI